MKLSFDINKIEDLILKYVHEKTGWGQPLRPRCEFEDLYIIEITDLENEKLIVTFEYHFDEDGFSQYDKNHILNGGVTFNPNFIILEEHLEETHTGIACVKKPFGKNDD